MIALVICRSQAVDLLDKLRRRHLFVEYRVLQLRRAPSRGWCGLEGEMESGEFENRDGIERREYAKLPVVAINSKSKCNVGRG